MAKTQNRNSDRYDMKTKYRKREHQEDVVPVSSYIEGVSEASGSFFAYQFRRGGTLSGLTLTVEGLEGELEAVMQIEHAKSRTVEQKKIELHNGANNLGTHELGRRDWVRIRLLGEGKVGAIRTDATLRVMT